MKLCKRTAFCRFLKTHILHNFVIDYLQIICQDGDDIMNEQEFIVDREAGINFCGGMEELYDEIIQDFATDSEERISMLTKYFNAEDWKNYVVEAYALKTTAKTIGAENFSEHSRLHEFAAREENVPYIKEDFENYIVTLRELVRRLTA